jgi:phosphopantothenate-cysteine ligase
MKVLVTSGGTRIAIDRVRHISNMSRGTFGSEIATRFMFTVSPMHLTFLRAEGSRSPFSMNIDLHKQSVASALEGFTALANMKEGHGEEYEEIPYKTFDEYAEALESECRQKPGPDIIVLAAAVSDYGTRPLKGKVRSKAADMSINLHKLPKLISKVRGWCPHAFLVGFKLLVDSTRDELIAAAKDSIKKNGCDLVVANDLRDIQQDNHKLTLVYPDGDIYEESKRDISGTAYADLADWLVHRILEQHRHTKRSIRR